MLGRATANSENWTTVSRTKKSNTNSNSNKFDNTDDFNAIKSRKLIITPKAQIGDIDSLLLRNQINSLFKDAKLTIVVNTVEKSKTGQNTVLTTSPENTAEALSNNKSIWELLFDPRTVRKDESWFKVIAHGINIPTFDENMQYLQDEIQKFNSNMQLCDIPRWLARDRQNKIKSSVVLTFNDRNMALNALKGVNIAGRHCDTEIFTSVRPNTQCINCHKFGYKHYQCTYQAKCIICAQNHETHNHECTTCKSKIACAHVVVKCVNCNLNHQSNDERCEMIASLNVRKSTDEYTCWNGRTTFVDKHRKYTKCQIYSKQLCKVNKCNISCLEYAVLNQIDIVLFQEPWTRDQKTISHPSFTCIMPKITAYRSRVAVFVTKCNSKLQCRPRTDFIDDSDMQIIQITIDDIRKVQIINIYNEKSQNDLET